MPASAPTPHVCPRDRDEERERARHELVLNRQRVRRARARISAADRRAERRRHRIPIDVWHSTARDWSLLPEDMLVEVFQFVSRRKHDGRLSVLFACRRWRNAGVRAFDPSVDNNLALTNAVRASRLQQVQRLLDDRRVDPNAFDGHALHNACAMMRPDVVTLFLAHPRVDPTLRCYHLLGTAAESGSARIMSALLADRRVHAWVDATEWRKLAQRACACGKAGVLQALVDDWQAAAAVAEEEDLFASGVDLCHLRWKAANISSIAVLLRARRSTGAAAAMISQWMRVWYDDVYVDGREHAVLRAHMSDVARLLGERVDPARMPSLLREVVRGEFQHGHGFLQHQAAGAWQHSEFVADFRPVQAFCEAAGYALPDDWLPDEFG